MTFNRRVTVFSVAETRSEPYFSVGAGAISLLPKEILQRATAARPLHLKQDSTLYDMQKTVLFVHVVLGRRDRES